MTFYYLPGVEQPIVRATWGPSKEDIATKRQYARTRENLSESIGRGKAVSGLMKAFQPLKPLATPIPRASSTGCCGRCKQATPCRPTDGRRGAFWTAKIFYRCVRQHKDVVITGTNQGEEKPIPGRCACCAHDGQGLAYISVQAF